MHMTLRHYRRLIVLSLLVVCAVSCAAKDLEHIENNKTPQPEFDSEKNSSEVEEDPQTESIDPNESVQAPGQVAGSFLVKIAYFPKKSTPAEVFIGIRLEQDGAKAKDKKYWLDAIFKKKIVAYRPAMATSWVNGYLLIPRSEVKANALTVKVIPRTTTDEDPNHSKEKSTNFNVVAQPLDEIVKD